MTFWQTINKLIDSHSILLLVIVVMTGIGAYRFTGTDSGAMWFDLFKYVVTSFIVFITTKWGLISNNQPTPPVNGDKKET